MAPSTSRNPTFVVPKTPRKSLISHAPEIDQFVETLNGEYGLGITVPDLRLSPRKRQDILRTEEALRVEQIHSLIRFLRFQNPNALSDVAAKFRKSAKSICTRWVAKPRADRDTLPRAGTSPKASSAEERCDLQQSLLALLDSAKTTSLKPLQLDLPKEKSKENADPDEYSSASRPSKRSSDGFGPRSSPKRPKSRPSSTKKALSALDDVPVRGKTGSASFLSSVQDTPFSDRQSAGTSSRSFADSVSTRTSRLSFYSDVFDQSALQEPASQTTVAVSQEAKAYGPGFDVNQSFYIQEGATATAAPHVGTGIPDDIDLAASVDGGPTLSEEQAFRDMEMEQANRELESTLQKKDANVLFPPRSPLSSSFSANPSSSGRCGPTSSEELALREASIRYDLRHGSQPAQGSSSFSVDMSKSDGPETVYSSLSGMVDMDPNRPIIDGASFGAVSMPPLTFDERLQCVWPILPEFLTHAPLPIIWEVTRAAIHCGVNLSTLLMVYDDSWTSQNTFYKMLKDHPAFKFKSLPGPCDKDAWKAAFGEFQHNGKAITLSMDATFNDNEKGPLFNITLQPLQRDLGHRLGRRFGSDRFLEVNFPLIRGKDVPAAVKRETDASEKITRWMAEGKHTFLGRIWAPFFLRNIKKPIKVEERHETVTKHIYKHQTHFFAEDGNDFEMGERGARIPPKGQATDATHRTKMQLSRMLGWAVNIPHLDNRRQKTMKLFSRLALSLSRTNPTVVLERSQMYHHKKDVLSPAGKVMNDGIGRMSRGLAQQVAERLGLDMVPSGFQARLGSAKGFWIVDVETYKDRDKKIWIETYPSQRKWECDFREEDHRTFEVKYPARELTSASLNQQFIPVLEDRAIDRPRMRDVLEDLLLRTIRDELDTQREALNNPITCQKWVYQGLRKADRILHRQVPFLGGLPKSDEETLFFLLCAGFDPKELQFMSEIIWKLAKKRCEQLRTKFRINVPRSTYAYMVIDFTGSLAEGEVHFAFSSPFESDEYSDTFLHDMDLLVARAPAHFPSDIQKVRAVFKPELGALKNVIVFSSRGNTPLADILSGGDYDGDQAWVCWDPDIVDNFHNAPVPQQPDLFKLKYLRKEKDTFEDLLTQCHGNVDEAVPEFVRLSFAFNMQEQYLGICTNYKEKLCYRNGTLSDGDAILLSTLLSNLVDQAKQGIIFRQPDWDRLRKKEIHNGSRVNDPAYAGETFKEVPGQPIHILDFLKFKVAKPAVEESLRDFSEAVRENTSLAWDKDLAYYFDQLEELADTNKSRTYKRLRETLNNDLHKVEKLWKTTMGASDPGVTFQAKVESVYQAWLDVQPRPEFLRGPPKTVLLGAFGNEPDSVSYWGKLKASTAFKLFHNLNSKFVFWMAGSQLQAIKAERTTAKNPNERRGPTSVVPSMYGIMRPDNKIITARMAQDEAAAYAESVAGGFGYDDAFIDDYGNPIDDA